MHTRAVPQHACTRACIHARAAPAQVALHARAVTLQSLASPTLAALHACAAKCPIQGVRAVRMPAGGVSLQALHGVAELFPGAQVGGLPKVGGACGLWRACAERGVQLGRGL